jgi:hypothetical protein
MPAAGLHQPRGADEESEHGHDHQQSRHHRVLLLSGMPVHLPPVHGRMRHQEPC